MRKRTLSSSCGKRIVVVWDIRFSLGDIGATCGKDPINLRALCVLLWPHLPKSCSGSVTLGLLFSLPSPPPFPAHSFLAGTQFLSTLSPRRRYRSIHLLLCACRFSPPCFPTHSSLAHLKGDSLFFFPHPCRVSMVRPYRGSKGRAS